MNNAVQWVFAAIALLAIALPLLFVGFARPWLRHGTQWRGLYWGMAVGVGFLVSAYMFALIVGTSGDVSRTRSAVVNEVLEATARTLGQNTMIALSVIGLAAVMTLTVVVATRVGQPRQLPSNPDLADLRTLVRKGVDVETLRSAYLPSTTFTEAEFDATILLGGMDTEARNLVHDVSRQYSGLGPVSSAELWEVSRLERAVRDAKTPEDAQRPLAELRKVVANFSPRW